MKGFPNQITDLTKLTRSVQCILDLREKGKRAKDDGVFGEALVRAGIAGTGHSPRPIDDYLKEQAKKKSSDQSFRATARGLRELFRMLGFIDDSDDEMEVTDLGKQAAAFAGRELDDAQIRFWRRSIRNMINVGKNGQRSHPYQVLLRLIARKPDIPKSICALAFEANNDSPEELERIVKLAGKTEVEIIKAIGVTRSNWENAAKVLPKFAAQLQDVIIGGDRKVRTYRIADAPGRGDEEAPAPAEGAKSARRAEVPRHPRSSRAVTSETIGMAGLADREEAPVPPDLDPAAARRAAELRADRLRRHNLIVRDLAKRLSGAGMKLYEDPFDILAIHHFLGLLIEVKTLNGFVDDERDRVQEALSQLLYYEAFVTEPVAGKTAVQKIAFFERPITEDHQKFLNGLRIATAWMDGEKVCGDALARSVLGPHLKEIS